MKLTVKRIEKLAPGRYGDGAGLYIEVTSPTNRCWLFRFERDGRERWMGLGSLKTFNLAEARDRAKKARQQLADGIDPLEARAAAHDAARKDAAEKITFKEAAERFLSLHEDGWRNAKHRKQWRSTLRDFAYPTLGPRPVKAIDTAVINAALTPIWARIPETAARTRHRIEKVLKWVKDGMPLPVVSGAANQTAGHAALPYPEIPPFMSKLRERADIPALALEFLILTAARTGEALNARWSEIDFDHKLWTVPATRMKAGREHRVPLPERAIEIIEKLPREHGNPYIFIGTGAGRAIGSGALLRTMRVLHPSYVPHGFRSTFKDWAAEMTHVPNIVSEAALAHAIGDKTEAAYRRGDMLEKRRHLMNAWAAYCGKSPDATGKVIDDVDFGRKVAGAPGL